MSATEVVQRISARKPSFKNGHDALVFALLEVMRDADFKIKGSGGELDSEVVNVVEGTDIPTTWNSSSDVYSFKLGHPRSAMSFVLKFLTLENRLLIHATAVEDGKHFSLELSVPEYVKPDAPLTDYENLYTDKLDDGITLFKVSVMNNLFPEINKPGYEQAVTSTSTTTSTTTTQTQAPRQPRTDPLRDDRFVPRRPMPPVGVPMRGGIPVGGPGFGLGHDDLNPGGVSGFGPRFGGSGGMMIGPGHPGFGPQVTNPYAFEPSRGGPGALPRGAVPPGARFDPFGPPPGPSPFGPGPGTGAGPDPDDMPPPGMYW